MYRPPTNLPQLPPPSIMPLPLIRGRNPDAPYIAVYNEFAGEIQAETSDCPSSDSHRYSPGEFSPSIACVVRHFTHSEAINPTLLLHSAIITRLVPSFAARTPTERDPNSPTSPSMKP